MDIFIKPVKKAVITGKRAVMLKDIAEVYCQTDKSLNIGETVIFDIPSDSGKKLILYRWLILSGRSGRSFQMRQ